MMTVDEAVRALGKSIQEDCRYKRYENAKKANDANEELQQQIGDFQMERMNYQRESQKENPDTEKLAAMEKELDAKYEAILVTEGMKEFQAAKLEMDAMMQEVDTIITLCMNGENPETCHPSMGGCSGNCASCGAGCH